MNGLFVARIGDMDSKKSLDIYVQSDGDVVLCISIDGIVLEDSDHSIESRKASVEFCTSGGRSSNTRKALLDLVEAIKKDNEENPLPPDK